MIGEAMTYYDVLGVPRHASPDQIRKAYREQVKFFHPDVFRGSEEIAKIKTQQLNEAFETLSDPAKRRDYDELLDREETQRAHQRKERQYEKQQRDQKQDEHREPGPVTSATLKRKKRFWIFFTIIVAIAVVLCVYLYCENVALSESNEKLQTEISSVNVRTVTFEDESTANYVMSVCKSNANSESDIADIMREYGMYDTGELIVIEPGDFVEEIDTWCFDVTRQAGDIEVIESDYGFTLCYISSVHRK